MQAEYIELNESRLPDNPSQKEIEAVFLMKLAMQNLLTGNNAYNIAMCIEGKQLSSEKLSQKKEQKSVSGKSTVNFINGSSSGIA